MTPIDIQLEKTAHHLNHLVEAVLCEPPPPPETLRGMAQAAHDFLDDGRTLVRGLTVCDMPGSDRSDRQIAHSMLRHGVHPHQDKLGSLTGHALREKLQLLGARSRSNGALNKNNRGKSTSHSHSHGPGAPSGLGRDAKASPYRH